MINDYCKIMNVYISAVNMKDTIDYLTENLNELRGQYVCIANVHTTVMAYYDREYRRIQNESVLTLPDGNPLANACRRCGYRDTSRVTGPDLMMKLFECSKMKGFRHYFYGSSPEVLDALKRKLTIQYPEMNIVGMYSPPYHELSYDEERQDVDRINETFPDFVWIGLGAPKQEQWMHRNRGKVDGLMIGVGAGFEFHADIKKRAPGWMQRLSLEWLFRLIQNPKRLWKRYLQTNGFYLFMLLTGRVYSTKHSSCTLEDKLKEQL